MRPPLLIKALFRSLVWNIKTKDLVLFLTFDDGPIPEVTPDVLEILKRYNAKATFFCIGENIKKHPEIFQQVIQDGHAVGNHTYNHLNGWKTKKEEYLENIKKCREVLNLKQQSSNLFRPPYGRITPFQYSIINKQYSIIMWDVLSEDWKKELTPEDCFQKVKRNAKPGSITVFHDSLKATERMKPALEKTLKYFSEKGFRFESLADRA
jgi:peptidoglycan-N-acetylglucosamine deacetylase